MKRLVYLALLLLMSIPLYASDATRLGGETGLVVGTQTQENASGFTVGAGDLYVADEIFVSDGLFLQWQPFVDLEAASTYYFKAGSAVSISTTALVASGTSWTLALADYTDIDFPSNITCKIGFAVGEATTTLSGTLTVVGTDIRGDSVTEEITISTTSAAGNYALASVTSLTISGVTCSGRVDTDDARIDIGKGTKFALAGNIGASTDVIKVIEDGAPIASTSYTVNTTYNTIDFATDPDGSNDYLVIFKSRSK